MSRLPPSLDLIRRAVGIERDYTMARMRVLEAIPGNPIGSAFNTPEPGLAALMARNMPSDHFNSVFGLRPAHVPQLARLADWYRQAGVPARVLVEPGDDDPALGRELARLGFFQSAFHARLIAEPAAFAPSPADVAVEQIDSAARMEDFLTAYVAGWSFPVAQHEQFKANVRGWWTLPGWSLLLARIDGRPVATATLFLQDGVCYFADASTDPAFRGRGLHAALLRHRGKMALAAAVEFVVSGARFLSTSHRNMERVGMRLMSLQAIWTQL